MLPLIPQELRKHTVDNELLNLDDPAPPENMLDLSSTPDKFVAPEVAELRAHKAAFGGAGDVAEIRRSILAGQEANIREAFAANVDVTKANNAASLINNGLFDPNMFKPTDPKSVFEQKYAEKVYDGLKSPSDPTMFGGTYYQLSNADPMGDAKSTVAGQQTLAWVEYLKHKKEDADQEAENQGYLGWGVDQLKDNLIPGWRSLRFSTVPGGTFMESPLPGDKMENLQQKIAAEPDFEKRKAMTETLLNALDPSMKTEMVNYLLHPNSYQTVMDNALSMLDFANIAGMAKAGIKFSSAVAVKSELKRIKTEILETAIKEGDHAPIPAMVKDAVGIPEEAGAIRFEASVARQFKPAGSPTQELVEGMQGVMQTDINTIVKGGTAGNLGGEFLNRMKKAWDSNSDYMINLLQRIVRPERLADILQDPEIRKQVYADVMKKYPGLPGNVLNIMGVRWDPIANRWVSDYILGTNKAGFFSSPGDVARFAAANGLKVNNLQGYKLAGDILSEGVAAKGIKKVKALGKIYNSLGTSTEVTLGEAKGTGATVRMVDGLDHGIYSQGKGYYLAASFPVDETLDAIRQAVIKTDKSMNKNTGWLNQMGLGWARTADEVLSEEENRNRKIALYAPALIKEAVHEVLKPAIKAIKYSPKTRWQMFGKNTDFERLLKYGQDNQIEFQNIPDLQNWYLTNVGRQAHEIEVAGYFAYRQGLAMDYSLRNIALVRNMARLGGEQHVILKKGADGAIERSASFVGVRRSEIPSSSDNVYIYSNDVDKVKQIRNLSAAEKELIEKGQRTLIQIYNPDDVKLLPGEKRRISYVLTDRVESSPLEFKQLPRRQGGHLEYDYDWYVKKPNINIEENVGQDRVVTYNGDKTIAAAENHFIAKNNAAVLNKVQDAMKAGRVEEAQVLARGVHGATWDEVKEMLDRYGYDQPFYATPKGKTVADVPNHFATSYGGSLRDTSKGGSLAKQFAVEFTGERDAYDVFAFGNDGTIFNPSFAYRPAEYVDPISSLARAVTRIADSSHMDDIKISSIESWLARYKGQLDEKWADEAYNNPWRTFLNAPLKSGLPANIANQINAERLQIKMFSKIPSRWDTALTGVQQYLEDSVYGAKSALTRVPLAITNWAFDTAMEVPSFMRKVTYRADIGLFSIPQLLVQSNTYVTIAGIAGFKKAGQGTSGALLHQYSRLPNVSEAILNRLDKTAQAMGWRPGEWLEAREALSRTGFDRVSREANITMSDTHGYKLYQSAFGSFLDAGDIFFKGGERNAKFGSWYTAFKEYRDAHPTGRLTNSDLVSITDRADLLSGNMTRASRSALQEGPLSFPTQFIGYSLRIMEQFTGKRLSITQKARLFGLYGAVYGVPFTTGLFSVVPFTNRIREYALEHGYIENENGIHDAAMNGIPSYLMSMITGTTYNVGQRYGNLDVMNNILAPDKTWWESLGGATLNTTENIWTSLVPFWKTGVGFVKGDPQLIKPTTADFLAPLKTFAAGNSSMRLIGAINTGEWLSRNEGLLKRNVPMTQAAFMTVTGLSPIEVDKINIRKMQDQNWKAQWDNAELLFTRDYRRFLRDMQQKNYTAAREHWNNANVYLIAANYPIQRRSDLFAKANQNQTIPDSELWNATFGKDVPASYERYRQLLFAREQQVKKNKDGG